MNMSETPTQVMLVI